MKLKRGRGKGLYNSEERRKRSETEKEAFRWREIGKGGTDIYGSNIAPKVGLEGKNR